MELWTGERIANSTLRETWAVHAKLLNTTEEQANTPLLGSLHSSLSLGHSVSESD